MKWKAIVGVVLAVASLAALYLWETKFEDQVTLTPVLVLNEDHLAGDTIQSSDLQILKINPQAKISDALTENEASLIIGKVLVKDVVKRQQLLKAYFISKEDLLPEGYVNFVIPSEWIYSKSVLIKERDKADIYAMPERVFLGTYKIDIVNEGSVEIIARLEDYFKIYDAINIGENQLLIVMEEDI